MTASSGPPRAEQCSVQRVGDVLRLSGEIDHVNAAAVAERIVLEIHAGVNHLDLSAVMFCGAAGVRALLAGRDAVPATNGGLRLTCSPVVLRVLQICGLADCDGLVVTAAADPEGPGPGGRP